MKFSYFALALTTLTSTVFSKSCDCSAGDVQCIAKCFGIPNPSEEMAELTLQCNASCTADGGNFKKCFDSCVEDVYLKFTDAVKSSSRTQESKTSEKTKESKTETKTESKTETKTSTKSEKTSASETSASEKSKSTDTASKDTNTSKKASSTSSFSRSAIPDADSSASTSKLALCTSMVVLASTALYYIL